MLLVTGRLREEQNSSAQEEAPQGMGTGRCSAALSACQWDVEPLETQPTSAKVEITDPGPLKMRQEGL